MEHQAPAIFVALEQSGFAAAIRQSIWLILATAPGERVQRPDFGCGLMQLVFAPNSPELAASLRFTLIAALQRWPSRQALIPSASSGARPARRPARTSRRPWPRSSWTSGSTSGGSATTRSSRA